MYRCGWAPPAAAQLVVITHTQCVGPAAHLVVVHIPGVVDSWTRQLLVHMILVGPNVQYSQFAVETVRLL